MGKRNDPRGRNNGHQSPPPPILETQAGDTPNLGLLFYKSTARELWNQDRYDQVSTELLECFQAQSLNDHQGAIPDAAPHFRAESRQLGYSFEEFSFKTGYLGLVAGLGYSHSTPNSDQEIKLGFSFDFTSGLPYIPGSSIKGRLRSFFPARYRHEPKRQEVTAYLRTIIQQLISEGKIAPRSFANEEAFNHWLIQLEHLIFDGKDATGTKRILSPLVQDVFFDAFPVESGNPRTQFLGTDSITPHPHPLKDPTPLRLLKILPDVKIKFQFRLNDEGLSTSEKKALFSFLLLRHGVGAKTRSGFGQFVDDTVLADWRKNLNENAGYLTGLPPLPVRQEVSVTIPVLEPTQKPVAPNPLTLKSDEVLAEFIGKDNRQTNNKLFRIQNTENTDQEQIVSIRYVSDIATGKKVVLKITGFDKKRKQILSAAIARWID